MAVIKRCRRGSPQCCSVMSCVVQTCFQSRIEPDSVGRNGHDGPHMCHPGHADEGDPRAAASSPPPGVAIVGERLRGASAGHAPPAFFPRGRCGVRPCQSGLLVSVAAHSAATPERAKRARFSAAAPLGRGAGWHIPPVHARAVFRRSFSVDYGLPRYGPPTRPSAGCLVSERRAEAVRPGPAGARRTEQHRAVHADAASTRPWPRRSRRCGRRNRRRRPSGWRRGNPWASRMAGSTRSPARLSSFSPPGRGSGLRRGGCEIWRWGRLAWPWSAFRGAAGVTSGGAQRRFPGLSTGPAGRGVQEGPT